MDDLWLNVSAVRRRSRVNGPGLRNAVWVQGCSIRCPGCFNADTHPHAARSLFDPERLADQLAGEAGIEGVTLLGGEPFEQAAACARFARRARALGASVVTYSGYAAASLRAARLPEVRELLDATDLLIAGPFVRGRAHDGRGWHGSTNQEFVYLTDRYDDRVRAQFDEVPVVEARVDGSVLDWTGIPAAADLTSGALVPCR
jgi:anaerobic ribonucleoside-triphosphate reductase activating protein